MTQIEFDVSVDNDCQLNILDITGFQPSISTGFKLESATSGTGYKLSEGYFKNVIQYNKHNFGPVLVNVTEPFTAIEQRSDTYGSNFTPQHYKLVQDGVYTITRVFVISDIVYNRDKNTGVFDDLVVYYSDGVFLYKVVDGVAVKSNVVSLLKEVYPTTAILGTIKIISTCLLNACYFKMMQLMLDTCGTCDSENKGLQQERDYIYMALESIRYLKEQGSIHEIEKLIETIDRCGGYCNKLAPSSNCGCNG